MRPSTSIEDLGSTNGTWVNNVRLEPGRVTPIAPGDVARVGQVVLVIQRGLPPRARAAGPAPSAGAIIVEASSMRSLYELVDRIARGTINVLVMGETGVGKEVVARAVHDRSPRADKRYVSLNGAALSETLLESELFGHERGAFTGADKAKAGFIEHAQGGTLFLDEVGELSAGTQAKLLRTLESKQVQRLGSLEPVPIDVRFVTATNRDLAAEVAAGRFRKDLYFRLNGATIVVPPLRERAVEIVPLARHWLALFCAQLGRAPVPDLSDEAIQALMRHHWPGNVRELRNVIERAVLLCERGPLRAEHLWLGRAPDQGRRASDSDRLAVPGDAPVEPVAQQVRRADLRDTVRSVEREQIVAALESCAGNQTNAARLLGISRRALVMKLNAHGLPRPRKRPTPDAPG